MLIAFQYEKNFPSNLFDPYLTNGSWLIWRKILHFNGLKSSNLKDVNSNLDEFHLSWKSEEFG